ncbi:hypothetical protein L228DRAFT_248501 [Xylona heveae TC161]|uniref:Cytochrome c oxidase, subunit VIb n=1 Tax=Xylona heveae (strain CBS 132557 / TC161) TaxID=1328760 RepID=A0A165G5N3_XYLHT|nr:hypothetical protein L228DRAFT_248501 [Xylona heveae TC161]KZF21765.1 hypothetical protein L228DRAFT_248501 [Xylona heveae TC161]
MGLFSSAPPAPAAPKPSADGAFEAPNRTERRHCWEARDGYFACLDRNNIIDSIRNSETANSKCGKEDQEFERNCATSWVQYFKKRRVMEYNRDQTLEKLKAEGAQPMPVGGPPGGVPPGSN